MPKSFKTSKTTPAQSSKHSATQKKRAASHSKKPPLSKEKLNQADSTVSHVGHPQALLSQTQPYSQQTSQVQLSSLQRFLLWLDNNILLVLTAFLLAFIPLFPKVPLADLIPGYIVRLRLEDLFVALSAVIFGIQWLRKKAEWKSPFAWLILAYAIIGLLSTISSVLITQTVPAEFIHISKTALHYIRYLQYFSLFFVAYAAVKSRKHIMILFSVFTLTMIAISAYGYGQKFFYWPVYSTMNREFSKGMRLYLTDHARVQSTFGGHYDMAAYLVIALPILLGLFFSVKQRVVKLIIAFAFLSGNWLLIVSASRTSFVAAMAGLGLVIALVSLQQKHWARKIWWGVSRLAVVYILLIIMFVRFGDSIYDRLLQTLNAYPQLHHSYHFWNDRRRHFYRDYIKPYTGDILAGQFSLSFKPQKPENEMSLEELEQKVIVSSDTRPTPYTPDVKPADVYVDVPDYVIVTTESGGVQTSTLTAVPRTFSDNANRYGLSMAIRLDTLWPRAIQGFTKNPILGSGYATLTKDSKYHFTEADSTDNNFLRTLGETGLLGFVSFYGVIAIAVFYCLKVLFRPTSYFFKVIAISFVGASFGLLLNAIFIDVFAASKVAFTYWTLTGMIMALIVKGIDQPVGDSSLTPHT